ncbi:MAG: hypothetical protein J0L82_09705 [Deltaproteobacteria bacterium]|nr:hypothetical protein [Deltaproteobacteria bacterium]
MVQTKSNRNRWPVFVSAMALAAAFAASANAQTPAQTSISSAASTEQRWSEFQTDPVKFMNMLPHKKVSGPRKGLTQFSPADVKSRTFIDKKNGARIGGKGFEFAPDFRDENGVSLGDIIDGRAGARENVMDFLDLSQFPNRKPVLNLSEMESEGLREGKLDETPWSDTYWPIYMGVLGARYANQNFSSASNWKGYYEFISSKSQKLSKLAKNANPLMLESLSPSEKYDLLIGDLTDGATKYEAGYLTPHMWEEGRQYWDEKGEVEPWMGICHGWAPAAYMLKRPTKTVEVPSADGQNTLKFYPSDIKGLGSYLWAKARVPTRFIGGRCNDKNADTDPETGRVLNEKCFDTNPANWHQIIVNQIGLAKKSFVMDATFDYEVWNQPVYSYTYKYFNPQTGKSARSLRTATVAADKFSNDKFKKFRSSKAANFVGIEMEVTYVVETSATHNEVDSSAYDATTTVTYMYDLELDQNMEIIGGEWYSNIHPDFLWNPIADGRAETIGDSRLTGTWDGSSALPKFWRDVAVMTAVHNGLPLASIIESLIDVSNKTE